ncbi:hypothetical protein CYMTET_52496 [Cymbomonas tetramitiformis]|uniref:Uncharacterized protein n=1 Tax=Cymbomonas tetramitiformis TaxID=36881 RepID=A0AAE0ESP4_9CHLO|nr:hypothetical protein CYMTET_52496 [Cymbomonas tetramitiformis]
MAMASELRRTRSARQQSDPEPDRASPPPRPRSRGRRDTVWLVRGGPGHGKYRIFAAAIDAGYYDRMPENAIKLVGDECEFADEWLGRPPKKTGRWAAFKKSVKRSNPFVRWLLVKKIEALVSENMIFVAGILGAELVGILMWFIATLVNLLFGED